MPGTPTVQHGPHGSLVYSQKICLRFQIGGQRHDGADIQIAIRPSIEPMTNTLSKGIVHRRMTKGTLNPNAPQSSLLIEKSSHSHNRVQLEQRKCRRRAIQIDLSLLQGGYEAGRKCVHIDFQAHREGRCRAHTRPDTTEFHSLNGLVKFQRVTPEGLIAESIEAKSFLPFLHHPFRVIQNHSVESQGRCALLLRLCGNSSSSNRTIKTDSQPCEKNQTDCDLPHTFHGIHSRLTYPARALPQGRRKRIARARLFCKDPMVSCGGNSVQKRTQLKSGLVQPPLP